MHTQTNTQVARIGRRGASSYNLLNKVLAAEHQTLLPNEKLIIDEFERSREHLEERSSDSNTGNERAVPQLLKKASPASDPEKLVVASGDSGTC